VAAVPTVTRSLLTARDSDGSDRSKSSGAKAVPTRFHATRELTTNRVVRDAGQIYEEIVSHFVTSGVPVQSDSGHRVRATRPTHRGSAHRDPGELEDAPLRRSGLVNGLKQTMLARPPRATLTRSGAGWGVLGAVLAAVDGRAVAPVSMVSSRSATDSTEEGRRSPKSTRRACRSGTTPTGLITAAALGGSSILSGAPRSSRRAGLVDKILRQCTFGNPPSTLNMRPLREVTSARAAAQCQRRQLG
jgi:hypothetical protein